MAIRRNFGSVVRPFAAAAIAVTMPMTLLSAAGMARGVDDQPGAQAALSGTAAVAQARKLLDAGQPVAARELIVKSFTLDGGATVLGDQNQITPSDTRTRAMELLAEANRKIGMLAPMELSLQKAQVALDGGDVRTAERHARAVAKSATATPDQAASAQKLLAAADKRRAELAPIVPDALAQAERDFDAGRYAEAKAGLLMVDRSGVALTAEQQATLDKYQVKIVEIASERPQLFASAGDMGMFQPGVVKRREDQPPAQPGAQPTTPPPAEAPVPLPEQPASQPVAQPEPPAAQPVAQPSGEDLVRQAMQTEARDLMTQADTAFDARRMKEAEGKYVRLRNEFRDFLSPDQVKHVEDRIAEARLILSGGPAPQPGQDIGPIIKGQTLAVFNNEMDMSDKSLAGGAPDEAQDHLARAELAINQNRQYFAETEFENLRKRVADMKAKISKTREELLIKGRETTTKRIQEEAAAADKTQRQEREAKIVELIDRARAYQSELRYPEALQAIDQLLFLDPINPTGLLLRTTFLDIIQYQRHNATRIRGTTALAALSNDNTEALFSGPNLINYPSDWPAISVRRGEPQQFAESPENRKVLADLNSGAKRIPSVAFNDNSLADVVQFIQTITQQNMDVDWASLEAANIRKETTVSLSLNNVTAKTLLDRVVEKISGQDKLSRADWAVYDGVITIASEEKIRKNTTLVIYDVRDLLIEVPDYTDVPRIDLQQALQASQQGGGGGGQSPFREQGNQNQQLRQQNREARIDDLISIITSNIDFEGWQDNGGDTGKIQKLTNNGNLIITNTAKNHRAIAGLLSKLREIRAMQINVETRFLLVNQDFFEQIGFDVDVYLNANNNQIRAAQAVVPTATAGGFFDRGRLQQTATFPNQTGTGTTTTSLVQPRSWSPIGFTQDSLGLTNTIAPRSDWGDALIAASPALGIAGQFLDDIQVDFLITATQADRRAVTLTAPRLTFTNGQTANIYVATQVAFVSDLTPVVGDSAVGFDPTISVVSEGVTMLVEGTVTADRRYVTLNVDAGVARIDGFAQQSVSAVAGGQLVNSASVQSFIQLPTVTITRVRTTVTVPDQGTLLMGGQRLITQYEVETGVPVLSKIPIINRFFTNRIESREEQTLLILVKPTILIQNEEEEKNYPGLMDSLRSGLGG